jgi:hypothetical protein
MDAKTESLTAAAELARDNPIGMPTKAPSTAPLAPPSWPRRSNYGATSSALPRSVVPCRTVAR